MRKIFFISIIAMAVTAGGALAQMGDGQHMMESAKQPQDQTPSQQVGQPYHGMMNYGMYPGMMTGYGVHGGMMGGYGMQQPIMGYMMGCGMHPGMMGYGMPHMYLGVGGDVEKQREFLKETSVLRKKLHDLMFDHMEAKWNPETKLEQLEEIGKEMQGLQQELFEKSKGLLK